MDPAIAFGQVLRTLRKGAGLSQEQLSFAAGIERNFVNLIERGMNQPTIRVIFKLSATLNILPSKMPAMTEEKIHDARTA